MWRYVSWPYGRGGICFLAFGVEEECTGVRIFLTARLFVSWPVGRGGVDRYENISHGRIFCILVFVLGPPQADCSFIVNIHELVRA
jgi:hypothetical protein